MELSENKESPDYDRAKELKAFDDSKTGVKGLIDAGIQKIPKIFVRPADELVKELSLECPSHDLRAPVIDLDGVGDRDGRQKIIDQVRDASREWGIFLVTNHGIPLAILDGMLDGIRGFHEQDGEIKKTFYSRERTRRVNFSSNIDLFQSRAANWRDTLSISMSASQNLDPEELPAICRNSSVEYITHVTRLGEIVFELLSEALGLKPNYLNGLECAKGRTFVCHYYPPCPQPELTLGTDKHTDPAFLTILLQDQIRALQVLHDNLWINVEPIPGALIVNIGDLLQILSNDEFVSPTHRVIANKEGPRISVASFFTGAVVPPTTYGPIKELTSEETKPALYKEFTVPEYLNKFFGRAINESGLDLFRLRGKSQDGFVPP